VTVVSQSDLTLEGIRAALAPSLVRDAAFDGWTLAAVESAARSSRINPATARIAFADGAMDMIAAWIADIDRRMAEALPAELLATFSVRERIRRLVTFRLEAVAEQRESLRRALAIMAMPQNLARTAKIGWHSADIMWRLAGDAAADFNHYTKRATLAGIYAATLAVLVDDKSEGLAETRAFLDRRIAGIMRFEKAKAQLLSREHFSPSRFLGRLRYPAR